MDASTFQSLKSDRHITAWFVRSASEQSKKHFFQKLPESEHLMFEITGVEGICLYADRSQWPGLDERNRGMCTEEAGCFVPPSGALPSTHCACCPTLRSPAVQSYVRCCLTTTAPHSFGDALDPTTPLPLDRPPSKRSQNSSDPLIQSARKPLHGHFTRRP